MGLPKYAKEDLIVQLYVKDVKAIIYGVKILKKGKTDEISFEEFVKCLGLDLSKKSKKVE